MQTLSLVSESRESRNNRCPNCGLVNFTSDASCKRCGGNLSSNSSQSKTAEQKDFQPVQQHNFNNQQKYTAVNTATASSINLRSLLGIAGSIVLFLGVFMPLVSMPIVGSINYFQNGKGDGVIIIVLAAISLFLTLTNRFKGLFITALGSFAVMGFTFFRFHWLMDNAREEMSKSDNIFKGLGEKMLDTVQLQWGWAILLVGAGLLIAAAFMKNVPQEDALLSEDDFAPTRNNTGLYAALAIGGVIVTAWICLVIVPQFNNGFNAALNSNNTATKENAAKDEKAAEAKKREPLLNALSVSITDKGFTPADFYAGRATDYLTFNLLQVNKTAKDIRAYKGVFVFRDVFGDEIYKVSFKGDAVVKAGQTKKDKMYVDYNQFMEPQKKLRSTEMENLRIEWQPEVVMFADGNALGLNGEQSYSLENSSPKTADEKTTAANVKEGNNQVQQSPKVNSRRNARTKIEMRDSFEDENAEVLPTKKSKTKTLTPPPPPVYDSPSMIIRLPNGKIQLLTQ